MFQENTTFINESFKGDYTTWNISFHKQTRKKLIAFSTDVHYSCAAFGKFPNHKLHFQLVHGFGWSSVIGYPRCINTRHLKWQTPYMFKSLVNRFPTCGFISPTLHAAQMIPCHRMRAVRHCYTSSQIILDHKGLLLYLWPHRPTKSVDDPSGHNQPATSSHDGATSLNDYHSDTSAFATLAYANISHTNECYMLY